VPPTPLCTQTLTNKEVRVRCFSARYTHPPLAFSAPPHRLDTCRGSLTWVANPIMTSEGSGVKPAAPFLFLTPHPFLFLLAELIELPVAGQVEEFNFPSL